MRTQNVSEYMLALALCLVSNFGGGDYVYGVVIKVRPFRESIRFIAMNAESAARRRQLAYQAARPWADIVHIHYRRLLLLSRLKADTILPFHEERKAEATVMPFNKCQGSEAHIRWGLRIFQLKHPSPNTPRFQPKTMYMYYCMRA